MRNRNLIAAIFAIACAEGISALAALAQNPPTPPPTPPGGAARGGGGGGQRGGGGRGRGAIVMTLSTAAWADGGQIPLKHSQAGPELSPPLTWSDPPETTRSFVLLAYDMDGTMNGAADGMLHWLVWNIPAAARGLPEGVPQGPQTADGMRQLSQSGPYYRGPAAPSTGPVRHYAFELFALDTVLTVEPLVQNVANTRAAVLAAMQGRVRGKAVLLGLFRRPPPPPG